MKFKNVVACLAVLAFVTGSSCALAKNVDSQQKVEKQEKVKKKNNQSNKDTTKKDNKDRFKPVIGW
ncbi:MAG: hypothetical protein PUG89_00300 [Succinivibrio sp.]|nr:hypothetical protein [Succinivibrio sp.]